MIPHVWACHVPLQPQLYLMIIVCLPMEIVSFSCVDNVQQLLFTSDHFSVVKKKRKSKMFQTWLGSRTVASKSSWHQIGFYFLMKYCCIYFKSSICHYFLNTRAIIIFNQNNFLIAAKSILWRVYWCEGVGKAVTHMTSNQWQTTTILSIPNEQNQVLPHIFSCLSSHFITSQ